MKETSRDNHFDVIVISHAGDKSTTAKGNLGKLTRPLDLERKRASSFIDVAFAT